LDKLGINLGYLLVQIVHFAIIFVVLRAWVYKPVLGILEKRRLNIAQGLEDARIAADARKNAEADAEKILSDAQRKASEVIREASERAEQAAREIKVQADADAAKARENAFAELEQERTRVLRDVRGQVGSLAIAAAHKLIGASLIDDVTRQHQLLTEFFSGVKDGKVVVLEGSSQLSGTTAEITSALPLTDEEQDSVKKELLATLGDKAELTYRVDPSILGGLVIRVGDRVMDGSVFGQLQELKDQIK